MPDERSNIKLPDKLIFTYPVFQIAFVITEKTPPV